MNFYSLINYKYNLPQKQWNSSSSFLLSFGRILDNLPLVVPVRRPDQELSTVYQHGFYVGLKGQDTGVSTRTITIYTAEDCP